jgi:hypothetical protein
VNSFVSMVQQITCPSRPKPSGKVTGAKLTVDQVMDIRAKYAAGSLQRELAVQYSVSKATICKAISGETWR